MTLLFLKLEGKLVSTKTCDDGCHDFVLERDQPGHIPVVFVNEALAEFEGRRVFVTIEDVDA